MFWFQIKWHKFCTGLPSKTLLLFVPFQNRFGLRGTGRVKFVACAHTHNLLCYFSVSLWSCNQRRDASWTTLYLKLKKILQRSIEDWMSKPWDVEVHLCRNTDLTAKQDVMLYAVQHLFPGHWAKMDLQKEQPQSPEVFLILTQQRLENVGKNNRT